MRSIICFTGATNPFTKAEYIRLNLKIERFSKIVHFVLVKLTTAGILLPISIVTIVNYSIFDLGENSFYMPCSIMQVRNLITSDCNQVMANLFHRLPFNWKTPFGYSVLILFAFLAVLSIGHCIVPIACLIVGSFLLVSSFMKDTIEKNFLSLNEKISNGSHMDISEQFCSLMLAFTEIKQLS